MDQSTWDELGGREAPSWYLHPLVANQKRNAHLCLISHWARHLKPVRVLKTDLFEEAFGEDYILPGLFPDATLVCGMDRAFATSRSAARRHPELAPGATVMDVRCPAWLQGSFDLIISTSTLDHFDSREEYLASLHGLAAALRPGGILILTLDNPSNLLFPLLRWVSRRNGAPFPLGYTPNIEAMIEDIRSSGFDIRGREWLLHNPRGLSTFLFLVLSRILGRHADPFIRALLQLFSRLGHLPTRRFTACFQAVVAVKDEHGPLRAGDPDAAIIEA